MTARRSPSRPIAASTSAERSVRARCRGERDLHARGQHPGNVGPQFRVRAGVGQSPHRGVAGGRLKLVCRRQHGDLVVQGDRLGEPTLGGGHPFELDHRFGTPFVCCWCSLCVHGVDDVPPESPRVPLNRRPRLRRFWRPHPLSHRAIRTEVRQRPNNKHRSRRGPGNASSSDGDRLCRCGSRRRASGPQRRPATPGTEWHAGGAHEVIYGHAQRAHWLELPSWPSTESSLRWRAESNGHTGWHELRRDL